MLCYCAKPSQASHVASTTSKTVLSTFPNYMQLLVKQSYIWLAAHMYDWLREKHCTPAINTAPAPLTSPAPLAAAVATPQAVA
jgi:hypothetical protein